MLRPLSLSGGAVAPSPFRNPTLDPNLEGGGEGRGGEGRRGGGGGPENRDGKAGVAGGRGEREKVALGEGVEG
jgi:hypothetical protein